MRPSISVVIALSVMMLSGCILRDSEPDILEKIEQGARKAGFATSVGYIAINKPTDEQVEKLLEATKVIRDSVDNLPDEGFISLAPSVKVILDKSLPGDENKALRILVVELSKTLLDELDLEFCKHDEWVEDRELASKMIVEFFTGAINGFENYLDE